MPAPKKGKAAAAPPVAPAAPFAPAAPMPGFGLAPPPVPGFAPQSPGGFPAPPPGFPAAPAATPAAPPALMNLTPPPVSMAQVGQAATQLAQAATAPAAPAPPAIPGMKAPGSEFSAAAELLPQLLNRIAALETFAQQSFAKLEETINNQNQARAQESQNVAARLQQLYDGLVAVQQGLGAASAKTKAPAAAPAPAAPPVDPAQQLVAATGNPNFGQPQVIDMLKSVVQSLVQTGQQIVAEHFPHYCGQANPAFTQAFTPDQLLAFLNAYGYNANGVLRV